MNFEERKKNRKISMFCAKKNTVMVINFINRLKYVDFIYSTTTRLPVETLLLAVFFGRIANCIRTWYPCKNNKLISVQNYGKSQLNAADKMLLLRKIWLILAYLKSMFLVLPLAKAAFARCTIYKKKKEKKIHFNVNDLAEVLMSVISIWFLGKLFQNTNLIVVGHFLIYKSIWKQKRKKM